MCWYCDEEFRRRNGPFVTNTATRQSGVRIALLDPSPEHDPNAIARASRVSAESQKAPR